jgi:hypothetical protein
VLIIDDAEALAKRETLRAVCGLLKLEYEERRLFSLVLAGGPELERSIAGDPALAHKVEVRVSLNAFDADSSAAYLTRRIQQAGGTPGIIDDEAVEALHRLGAGLPGRINTLADNALFEAFLCGRTRMGSEDVERVHRDLGWDRSPAAVGPAPVLETPPAPAVVLGDLDSDLEAVFDVDTANGLPGDGPPKDEEDLVVELLTD